MAAGHGLFDILEARFDRRRRAGDPGHVSVWKPAMGITALTDAVTLPVDLCLGKLGALSAFAASPVAEPRDGSIAPMHQAKATLTRLLTDVITVEGDQNLRPKMDERQKWRERQKDDELVVEGGMCQD